MPKKPEMAEVPRYITGEGGGGAQRTRNISGRSRELRDGERKLPPIVAQELRELCIMLRL